MNTTQYCTLGNFSKSYEQLHGVLSLTFCGFGTAANLLIMSVLLRKDMRWPTNFILIGLAIADLLVMIEYIPFSFHRYIYKDRRNYVSSYTRNWAIFMYFHALFSQIFHFISCCLTVILAIWRYVTISQPHHTRVWFSLKRTLYAIILVYICGPLICSPIILSLSIKIYNQTSEYNGKIIGKQHIKDFKDEEINTEIIYLTDIPSNTAKVMSFWVYSVVLKLVPCILLTHLSWKLIAILMETKKRKKVLLQTVVNMKDINSSNLLTNKKKKVKQADRTSNMLLALLFLFLITEFPQAILGLLSAILEEFEKQCYRPLGQMNTRPKKKTKTHRNPNAATPRPRATSDFMDLLALINSATNVLLYCTMSRQFRITFMETFFPTCLNCTETSTELTQHSAADRNGERTQISQAT